ncbi:BTAD domain-containing putative transcriptional regulator [Nonomuraea sp. NPDC048916]|uniref:AfsR/SARP family transcriptional regulator n=1 Tax=Nonomuraea sp. NPDC048916 TaxID=3154232 RepID=UPI00340ACE06
MERARFGVLGPLRVEGGQVPGPAKHRALLAALLVSAGRVVPIERLMALVWDDRPPASAEPVLRVYVSALRKLVDGITTAPGGYLIDVPPDDVDCHRFERLVGQARTAREAGRAAEAVSVFKAALGLWRGAALADVESSVLRRLHAVPLEELRLTALEERVALDLSLGRGAEVVGELRGLVAAYPLRERAWARLLDALCQVGRRSEALEAYQEARRTLVEELGLEPGAELREAHRRVLSSEAAPAPSRRMPINETPPDISDFTGRAHVLSWITAAAAAQTRTPAPGAAGSDAAGERAAGSDAAGSGTAGSGTAAPGAAGAGAGRAPVALVIHGPPGCGKSAVAVHAATGLDLPDGRLYASLGARPPGAVLEDLLRSLGCPDGVVPAALDERVRMYRSLTAGRSLLLVLDDAADEAQVRPLLPTGPGSLTLVTSRSPLAGLEAARAYELGVLDPDEAVAMLAGVAGRARVAAEPEAARRIVRLCDGLPLALRIAGSRLARKPGWTLDHLAGRLGDERRRLDELSAGDLAVRGSLALGYRGLVDPERRSLRRLGALSAPDFAPWVLGADLEPLAEAGLLQSRGLDEAGQERYGWHDLTRLYAAERLAEEQTAPAGAEPGGRAGAQLGGRAGGESDGRAGGEPGGRAGVESRGRRGAEQGGRAGLGGGSVGWREARRRVLAEIAGEVLDRTRRARTALVPAEPGSGQTVARTAEGMMETGRLRAEARWLGAERRFLVATVGDFHDVGLYEAAWRLAFYLTPLFELGAHHDDWHATTATGLDAARAAGHRQGEALLLRGLADLHRAEGRPEAAAAALRAAQPLVEGLDLARITLRLGLVEQRPEAAERALARCLRVFEEAGDQRGRADALRALGAVRRDLAVLEASLAAYRELGDPRGEAESLLDLAGLHLDARRHAEARECAERRLRVNRRLGDRLPEAASLLLLARIARSEGVPDAAEGFAREAVETFERHGDRRGTGRALLVLAEARLDLDEIDGAVEVITRAMGEFDVLSDIHGRAEAERLAREARRRGGRP